MLEKNEKFLYFDAHFHLADCVYDGIIKGSFPSDIFACTCSHSVEEWEITCNHIGTLREPQGPRLFYFDALIIASVISGKYHFCSVRL